MLNKENLPPCSIIIPVFNNRDELKLNLKALKPQVNNYPKAEVIVIDNGSTDDSVKEAQSWPFVNCLKEHEHLESPYSARNRGIEHSTGEVIILLDAKCIPSENWLFAGINDLINSNADLIGGDIKFRFSKRKKAAEIFDSLTNIQMEKSVKERGIGKGGNLFIKREVFSKIGLFPEGLRSGGDVSWTKKATSKGYKLKFSPDAIAYYKARSLFPLIKKQFRVGKGQPKIWDKSGERKSVPQLFFSLIKPVSPMHVYKLIEEGDSKEMKRILPQLWVVANIIKLANGTGNIIGTMKLKKEAT